MKRCHDSHYSYCTPDLDAMREYAVPQLLLRKEKSKVLFVICDGLPEVGNHVLTDRMRFSYKKYIRVVKSMGIKVFAFGIKTDVSAFFDNDWAYVDTDTLGQTLVDKLHEYLFRKD
jgi:cobalamin biosynthesis protein CobT